MGSLGNEEMGVGQAKLKILLTFYSHTFAFQSFITHTHTELCGSQLSLSSALISPLFIFSQRSLQHSTLIRGKPSHV